MPLAPIITSMREINRIIIHCAATPNGREFHASDIDRWHRERGWRCIGYHYVIALDGAIEDGRPVEEIGAHCKGYNHDSIGICLIGTDQFTASQWRALNDLLRRLTANHPGISIHGHNEFNPHKTCPGFPVQTWLVDPDYVPDTYLLEMAP